MRLLAFSAAVLLSFIVLAPPAAASGPLALVKDINPTGNSVPTNFASLAGVTYFSATDGVHGRELWRSDGTADGTYMVRGVRAGGGGSDPKPVATMGGSLYFAARDGARGHELWRTDGTPAGTRLVKDITPGGAGTWPVDAGIAAGSHFFFNVDRMSLPENYGLWSSDGTSTGTIVVGPWAEHWVALGANLYFLDGGSRLWRSDGTSAGTTRVRWAPSSIYELAATNNLLYIMAADPMSAHRYDVYATNGTKAHLRKVTTESLEYRAWPSLGTAGDHAFFVDQHRLWRSNGTVRTTKALKTFASDLYEVRPFGSMVWLNTWDAQGYPSEIWRSNGSSALTQQVDVSPLPLARDMVGEGDMTFWWTLPYGTWTLWQSDATTAGARAVASLDDASSGDLFVTGDRLFFALDDGVSGSELWSYGP